MLQHHFLRKLPIQVLILHFSLHHLKWVVVLKLFWFVDAMNAH